MHRVDIVLSHNLHGSLRRIDPKEGATAERHEHVATRRVNEGANGCVIRPEGHVPGTDHRSG